jgi:hypothetical protein
MRLRITPCILAACLWAAPAVGQTVTPLGLSEVTAGPAEAVFVTIYRDDLALITETRTVDLPAGRVKIAFEGVLDSVIAPSAVIRGFEGLEAERNFDFDGLSPRSLLAKSIGERVTLVRTNPATGGEVREDATVQAAGDGVALAFKDRFEALGCSGLPERLVFEKTPAGLRAKPTLSTTLTAAPPGRATLSLSYLATGLSWRADYVATLDPARRAATLIGWVSLTNAAANGFADAGVGVVAGDLSRVFTPSTRAAVFNMAQRACYPMKTTTDLPPVDRFWERASRGMMKAYPMAAMAPPPPPPPPEMAMAVMADGDAMMRQEQLSDYQLYTMPAATSVAANQTKQVAFLARSDVLYETRRRVRLAEPRFMSGAVEATTVVLALKNEEARGLGVPLPRGAVRVMGDAGGGPMLIGQDDIRDTAIGLDLRLEIAASSAVTAQPTVTALRQRTMRDGRVRKTAAVEVRLANASAAPAIVEVVQPDLGPGQRIVRATTPLRLVDGERMALVPVPARGAQTLRYTVRWIEPGGG